MTFNKKEYMKEYFQRPEVKTRQRDLNKKNREKIKKRQKDWYLKNREYQIRKSAEYSQRPENREKIKNYKKRHAKLPEQILKAREYGQRPEIKLMRKAKRKEYIQSPEFKKWRKEYDKKYFEDNEEHIKEYYQKYNQREYVKEKNRKRATLNSHKKYRRKYFRERFLSDKPFFITHKLRNLLYLALKLYSTTGKIKTSKEYGIDWEAVINHLKPFPKDIQNYHIDHIIPLSRFDFNNPEHIKKAFSPSNHQWLTAMDNMEKGNRLLMPQSK